MTRLFTGFAIDIEARLLLNGVALTQDQLAAVGSIEAALVTTGRALAPGSAKVACTLPGDGTIRASWSAAQSAAITPGRYLIEFRTSDGPYCHEGQAIELLAGVSP